ncbi:MAG: DUF2244 domain-containing protein [Casimicrobiaceae bacterium]
MPTALANPAADLQYSVIARRNDSLGSRGRWLIFTALCAVSLGLALAFAAFGAWLVLPYSVLEMGVLFLAFWFFERHAGDWESLTVDGDRVVVERQRCGVASRQEFNRFWTRLEWEPDRFGQPSQLAVCHGMTRLRFGADLAADARAAIAKDLRRALAGARR